MSDSGVGQFSGEVIETIKEVANDVKDAVGEMIEQGVQSVSDPTLTPQQIQQKQEQDQKELMEARRKIAWYRKIDEEQKRVREENKQKEMQRLQSQQQQEQVEVQKDQQKTAQKQQSATEAALRSSAELKIGKGVGG